MDPDDLDPLAFEAGTMRPKVEAAATFVRDTGKRAVIGRSEDISELLAGNAGTLIKRSKAARAHE
jgi:carbamate kinase